MTQDTMQLTAGRAPRRQVFVWMAALGMAWFLAVLAAAASGVFAAPPDEPPLAMLAALAIPLAVFATAMALSPAARAFALGLDPVLLTEMQAWRILGGLFLALYAFGQLPGLFAWPAGLGDVAVGVAAPFVAWALWRNRDFLATAGFRRFHLLGLLDFVVAVGTGITARSTIPGLVDQVTSAPMGVLPLVMIPTFAVPIFIILHFVALMQSAAARR